MDRRIRVALYGRVSGGEQKRRMTIEQQRYHLRQWAEREGLTIVGEYWDEAVKGWIALEDRPQGSRLVADARAGMFDVVAVAYIDRFGRTLLDGLRAAKMLEDLGVAIVSTTEGINTLDDRDPLNLQIRLIFAEQEHRRIKERMESGKERFMRERNAPPTGILTFGYRLDDQGHYLIEEREAAIVRFVFEKFVRGWTYEKILRVVETMGVPPGRRFQKLGGQMVIQDGKEKSHLNARWHISKISKIVHNRTYLGERRWQGRVFPCPPIITPEVWEQAQLRLKEERRGRVFLEGREYGLLSGLLRCGHCGSKVYICKNTFRHRIYYKYNCREHTRNLRDCDSPRVRAEKIDEALWNAIVNHLQQPETIARVIQQERTVHDDRLTELDQRERELIEKLASIDREVELLWQEADQNGWSVSFISPRINTMHERRKEVEQELALLRSEREIEIEQQAEVEGLERYLLSVRDRLAEMNTFTERLELVKKLVRGGVLRGRVGEDGKMRPEITVEFRWSAPAIELLVPDVPCTDVRALSTLANLSWWWSWSSSDLKTKV